MRTRAWPVRSDDTFAHLISTKGWGDLVVRGRRGGGREGWWGGRGQESGKVKVCVTFQLSEPVPHQWEITEALIGINNGDACGEPVMVPWSDQCMLSRVKGSKVVPHYSRFYNVLSPMYHHSCWIIIKTLIRVPAWRIYHFNLFPVCDNENLFLHFLSPGCFFGLTDHISDSKCF